MKLQWKLQYYSPTECHESPTERHEAKPLKKGGRTFSIYTLSDGFKCYYAASFIGKFDTLEQAKAFCQAEHERAAASQGRQS